MDAQLSKLYIKYIVWIHLGDYSILGMSTLHRYSSTLWPPISTKDLYSTGQCYIVAHKGKDVKCCNHY